MTPKKMKQILWGGLIIIVLTVSAGLYLSNTILTNLAHKTTELRSQTEINQQKLSIYEDSRQRVKELGYVNELAQKILPTDYNQSATIAELSQFAQRSNLRVADITFDISADEDKKTSKKDKNERDKKLPKDVTIIPLTLVLQEGARYSDVLNFLTTIEQSQRKMQIVTVSLTPSQGDGSTLEQVALRINVYAKQESSTKTEDKP